MVAGAQPVTTPGGTANTLTKFDAAADIANSQIVDNGKGVGIGTAAPQSKLDVNGSSILRGTLTLPSLGTANATKGTQSNPLNITATSFDSAAQKSVNQSFQWQAGPVSNNTATRQAGWTWNSVRAPRLRWRPDSPFLTRAFLPLLRDKRFPGQAAAVPSQVWA